MQKCIQTLILGKNRRFLDGGDNDIELNGTNLRFGELSDGYRSLLALLGHLLRSVLTVCDCKNDLDSVKGIALVDEIDLHLHPEWQKHVVHDFRNTFPEFQLITSTHSPLVVGALDASSIHRLSAEGAETKIVRLDSVLTETQSMRAWRADQILTGPGFNLETSISKEAENWDAEFETLWSIPKNERTSEQKARLSKLGDILKREVPKSSEPPHTREVLCLFERWTIERLKARPPEEIARIIKEVRDILEEGEEADLE